MPLASQLEKNETVQELVSKSRGELLIVGEELDLQVREYLLETRRNGEGRLEAG